MNGFEIENEDAKHIVKSIPEIEKLSGETFLITGGAGFLGYYFILAILNANDNVLKKPCAVVCLDNFMRGAPQWFERFKTRSDFKILKADVTTFDYSSIEEAGFIVHAASIASPSFYRKYPIETMDANVGGLRRILDYGRCRPTPLGVGTPVKKKVKSILYLSSSEIYGDPSNEWIPTPEDYRGYVSSIGPRASYDESKRFGETLCVNFNKVYGVPVKIARPFNNYGPGLSLDDKRVIPDFSKNILEGCPIAMFSDGRETRSYCYVSDAISGYMKILLSDYNGEAFNIGVESQEVSTRTLAEKMITLADELFGQKDILVVRKESSDKDYLTDNPSRRCPSISKARRLLGYSPQVSLDEGLKKMLLWYKENYYGIHGEKRELYKEAR